ncbi:indolepyruvate ferredoxin oxidoreductase [Roseiarcus fermentans]|uniref:Indolepyruvate ferredoxin oxidoreductase n=1 Tax=Roseiarcus fermentans TaxID=1473586 RepID=A0A366F3F4_9HYPH|nr:indolepyruvate ferredoxin oxidoreductase family protein [Roseiarcus fermentans]RBP08245.1 indolepyruvate ferredoxin oxidoreductase [Roseiarcus fermentans]
MTVALARSEASLEDRWTKEEGWFYMTGMQALTRLPIQQRLRDIAAGLNTGGYISGYRGSPMGRFDIELWRAEAILRRLNVVFRPGLNEDLAATAIWGAQHVASFPGATVEGVFGIWYGKGPGVDRSGDALRHANFTGTSAKGGALALAGDDHGARSSTAVNFSDTSFVAIGMPVLYPSNTQELIDFGLHGIAMSRFSGCWVGMKIVTDVAEGGGTVYVGPDAPAIVIPERPTRPPGGVSARTIDAPLMQEERLYQHKLPAALAYARANALDRIVARPSGARVGVVAAGKAWQDLLQALGALGLGENGAGPGLRLLKVGMVWPLDPAIVREFAAGLDLVVVIEEKRPLLEDQIRAILYGGANAPRLIGKFFDGPTFDPAHGALAIPNYGETSPELVADTLVRALRLHDPASAPDAPQARAKPLANRPAPVRAPGFCAGCPHNRSTRVPEGSRALAGIGCHTMAMFVNPAQTTTVSHMGGEGAMWLGQQPFTAERHVFANLGDGTYAHSGLLAIRQAVAANVPITYKILYNGFVSMTGGQPIEGGMTPAQILAELAAEGVGKLALVADDPDRYRGVALPQGALLRHRDRMDETQREFRDHDGVSVIVYDQPCATERRRLRKRGKWADPAVRTFIHPDVCEGCGDCGKVSNCMAIEPLETEWGRKRAINQSSCNKDFSCVEGFCPSFVTVHGGRLRKASPTEPAALPPVPEPALPEMGERWSVLVAGIGGSGVVTVSQTLAVAAWLDGLYASNLDLTGLSQKYGAVAAHVRFARAPEALHATRIAAGEADALIGCDLIVAAGDEALSKLKPSTRAVIDADLIPTSEFARNPDWSVDREAMLERLTSALAADRALVLDAQRLAKALMGDPIAANLFMLGAAWQRGLLPVSRAAIERAIELNGVAVEANARAFAWGRRAAHDPAGVDILAGGGAPEPQAEASLDALIARRAAHVLEARGRGDAARYRALVERVRARETALGLGEALTAAAASSWHRLIAVKDEWEVARLFAAPAFAGALGRTFEGPYRVHAHIGAWPFARRDRQTGAVTKREAGPWALMAFRVMARLRFLRGSPLDPFRSSAERTLERRLMAEFEGDVERTLERLSPANHAAAVRLLSVAGTIRGYGRVKEASAAEAATARAAALRQFEAEKAAMEMAA